MRNHARGSWPCGTTGNLKWTILTTLLPIKLHVSFGRRKHSSFISSCWRHTIYTCSLVWWSGSGNLVCYRNHQFLDAQTSLTYLVLVAHATIGSTDMQLQGAVWLAVPLHLRLPPSRFPTAVVSPLFFRIRWRQWCDVRQDPKHDPMVGFIFHTGRDASASQMTSAQPHFFPPSGAVSSILELLLKPFRVLCRRICVS